MDYDNRLFTDIDEIAKHRRADYSERDEVFRELHDMSLGHWEKFEQVNSNTGYLMPIVSPDPANFIDGLVRILTPNDPYVNVPKDQHNPNAVQNADKIEKVGNAILQNAGRVRGDPLHFDIMRNAVTFSEVHVGMSSTWDIVRDYEARLKEERDKGKRKMLEIQQKRVQTVAESTPYLIDVFDPRTGYPEWDKFGLCSYLRVYNTTVRELVEKFGDRARKQLSKDTKPFTVVSVCDYFDLQWHQIWIEGNDAPLLQEEHGLPFIPVVAEIIQGTLQGDTPVQKRKPALYNYWKSGMWHADNLFFTITFSNIFAMLTMPPFVEQQTTMDSGDAEPELDFDAKPPRIKVPYGKQLSQMQMKVITPDILALHDLAQAKGIESTMYRQAMGEPLSGSPSYSLVAFLAQSAKTVLNTIIEKTSWLIADVAKMGLKWMQSDSGTYTVRYGQDKVSLMSADIPEDDFLVECKLNVRLPQDMLGASNIVAQLSQIPDLPLSKEWMVEKLLGIDNVVEERERKWSEQVAMMEYQKYIQQKMMEDQAMQQSAMQGMPGAGLPSMQGEPPMQGTPPRMEGEPSAAPGTPGTLAREGIQPAAPIAPPVIPPGGLQ